MFTLIMTDPSGRSTRLTFVREDITIGRAEECEVVVRGSSSVGKQHARLVYREGRVVVVDLGSPGGTFINGNPVKRPTVLKSGDVMRIADHTFATEDPAKRAHVQPPPLQAPPPLPGKGSDNAAQQGGASGEQAIRRVLEDEIKRKIHERLIDFMDLRRLDIDKLGDEELRRRTEVSITEIMGQMVAAGELPSFIDRKTMLKDVLDEALGLGPLEEYLADETITEVMVNNSKQIYIERDGLLFLTPKTFSSDQAVMGVIERIVAPLGRRIDESSPMVDARLKDGSRVNAIIPPLALKGPSITIRKFKKDKMTVEDLINVGSFNGPMVEFLRECVGYRKNCIISGGTGSGKTTLLNALSGFIPDTERIVTVEDAAELQLRQDHWVALEARPPNIEGKGQISIRDLVKNCLRMRPDRIVVGECRGGEALDMLQAMNTGHDGSLTTIHSNSPRDSLSRIETMVLMAGMDLPIRAIRDQVASAIHIIIHLSRFPDGTRKVTQVTEVTGMEVDIISMQDIFHYKQEGFDENGRVKGRFVATGNIPKFYDDLQTRGIKVDLSLFR